MESILILSNIFAIVNMFTNKTLFFPNRLFYLEFSNVIYNVFMTPKIKFIIPQCIVEKCSF